MAKWANSANTFLGTWTYQSGDPPTDRGPIFGIPEKDLTEMREEIAKLREVNAAQAEQIRKAQERIRAAEAERDDLRGLADDLSAEAHGHHETANSHAHYRSVAEARVKELEAERDRAWNYAIEAAARCVENLRTPTPYDEERETTVIPHTLTQIVSARAIRSLAKQEGGE